jgi:hypothetical protein
MEPFYFDTLDEEKKESLVLFARREVKNRSSSTSRTSLSSGARSTRERKRGRYRPLSVRPRLTARPSATTAK